MATPRSEQQKPKVQKRTYLRPDEANRLIEAAGRRGRYPFRDKVLVRLAYRHGLRASEAVRMHWDQIDLDEGTIQVKRVKRGNPSNHTMDRDELRDLRKLRRDTPGLYVFETERGGLMSVDAFQYIVKEAGKLAKLEVSAHPHQLRHAAGYFLINDGVDVRLVQDFLGHRHLSTTALYTQIAPGKLRALRVR